MKDNGKTPTHYIEKPREDQKAREIAQTLRQTYSYMGKAQTYFDLAGLTADGKIHAGHMTTGSLFLGFAMGTLGLMIGDLEAGTYPLRKWQVSHPLLQGGAGDTSTDEKV